MTTTWGVTMLLIALVLVLAAAAAAAVVLEAGRVMLPAVERPLPLDAPVVGAQRTRTTSPDAQDDARNGARGAYTFVASLPAEPREGLNIAL